MHDLMAIIDRTKPLYCEPDGFLVGEAVKIFNTYMQTHPEQLDLPAIALFVTAMQEAFPCRQSWSRKSEQSAKWSFCLTAGKIDPRIRRDHEQTSSPDAHAGLQGEGGACRHQG